MCVNFLQVRRVSEGNVMYRGERTCSKLWIFFVQTMKMNIKKMDFLSVFGSKYNCIENDLATSGACRHGMNHKIK